MRGAVLHAPGDVRFEERADPKLVNATDADIRTVAACVCGSDLWDYRGINPVERLTPFGHEYVGIVEVVGDDVKTIKPGQFVIGSFFASDNTCANCQNGYQTNCLHREFVGAGVPARSDRPGPVRPHRPGQGLRPGTAAPRGRRGHKATDERRAVKALLRP